jgi:hypothetical protein
MAYYLVRARPKQDRLSELEALLEQGAFAILRPFGRTLTASLREARLHADGVACWEEEDYCSPPLAQERAAVLDHYFDDLQIVAVKPEDGWRRIRELPRLFPNAKW